MQKAVLLWHSFSDRALKPCPLFLSDWSVYAGLALSSRNLDSAVRIEWESETDEKEIDRIDRRYRMVQLLGLWRARGFRARQRFRCAANAGRLRGYGGRCGGDALVAAAQLQRPADG